MIQLSVDTPLGCSSLEPSLCSSPEFYLLSDLPKTFNPPASSSYMANPHANIPGTSPAKVLAESQHQLSDMWMSKWTFRLSITQPLSTLDGAAWNRDELPPLNPAQIAGLFSVLTILPLVMHSGVKPEADQERNQSFTFSLNSQFPGRERDMLCRITQGSSRVYHKSEGGERRGKERARQDKQAED